MRIRQRKQKIPFYISFLIIAAAMLLFGIFAPEPEFSGHYSRHPRSDWIAAGVIGLITSTLWFFFGSIDGSTWNQIKKAVTHTKEQTTSNNKEDVEQ